LAELESYLLGNPGDSHRVEALIAMWEAKRPASANKQELFNRHMQRLSSHLSEPVLQYEMPEADVIEMEEQPVRRNRLKKILWTASVAASLFIGYLVYSNFLADENRTEKNTARNTVSTKRGSKSKVVLPDGTQVWLNADSRITYNEKFQGTIREVDLTGEAYFDVVRDETRPFIIHTSTIDVKVLGTAFNVRSYAEEKNTETSLIRGSVEITLVKSADKRKIILKPNDKLIVANEEGEVVENEDSEGSNGHKPVLTLGKINYRKKENMAVETLWMDNKLAFDGETLEEIALKIERWYDVKLHFADEDLKSDTYTATFEDKTLSEVLDALQASGGLRYSIDKKDVTLSAR
jgi:ferric-dicitrate binding protein FerR (iron transport regulator)